jgi:hypothetical protein
MSTNVYYQDGKVTITDKVIVTKEATYQLSAITGLASKIHFFYIAISIALGALFAMSVLGDIRAGLDPTFVLIATTVLFAAIYGLIVSVR